MVTELSSPCLDRERPVQKQLVSSKTGCAAAIVAFKPDAELIVALARAVAREAMPVIVFANSPIEPGVAQRLGACGAELIVASANVGLGEAFNQCADAARARGAKRLLLLDQDSEAPDGLVAALKEAMDRLTLRGDVPGVIGPRIVAPPGVVFRAPRYFPKVGARPLGAARPVEYVISSGSLIDLDTLSRVGPFRADFFIDAIDTEWCFRAWSRGASCWVLSDVELRHRIGEGIVRNLGRAIPRQAKFRLYAYVRNQSHCLTLAHVPLAWKALIAAHVLRVVLVSWVDQRFSLHFLGAMFQAAQRGLRGKLGPPPGAELEPQLS